MAIAPLKLEATRLCLSALTLLSLVHSPGGQMSMYTIPRYCLSMDVAGFPNHQHESFGQLCLSALLIPRIAVHRGRLEGYVTKSCFIAGFGRTTQTSSPDPGVTFR
ncbi:hypothetical protein BC629DRAFT_1537868 [Irpex lacteus]|nr:hypothetical protein BC629DRAFT_1537868 [Irpex lacteus]